MLRQLKEPSRARRIGGHQWLTTESESLWRAEVQEMVRAWTRRGRAARGTDLTAVRSRNGVNLLAIVAIKCGND